MGRITLEMINESKFNLFLSVLTFSILILLPNVVFAQFTEGGQNTNSGTASSTEAFLNNIKVDLPDAELTCRGGGSLRQIIRKSTKLKSGGNAFFIDKVSRSIGLFEKAAVTNNDDKKTTIDVFIDVNNVSKQDLENLLLNKNLVISRDAKVIFAAKFITSEGEETFIYDGKDENNNDIGSVLFTKINKISTIIFNDEKFFTADAIIKIRFPIPPKKIDASGNRVDVFSNFPGTLVCNCTGCPIHDFDLTDLKDAFNGKLVQDITNQNLVYSSCVL